jgi:pimeloyl-ACP methyl ester carboxylesterase
VPTDRTPRPADAAPPPSPAAGRATIVFSHANGFPAGTYRQLFEAWRAAGWRVLAIDKLGHDPRYPVSLNWPHLRDELIHFIEREAGEAVWLAGHSLGGFVSVLAASKRPALARGIVLLDSPILPPLLGRVVQFGQASGLARRYSPGAVSRRRRFRWPDAEAAYQHFASKPAFARWAPGVLHDYIASGTEPTADGRQLAFSREVETAIYDNLPHHIARLLRREPLRCPVAFIGGTESTEVKQVGLRTTKQLTDGRVSWITGSHLFPFEQPAATAAEVLRWLAVLAERSPPLPSGDGATPPL